MTSNLTRDVMGGYIDAVLAFRDLRPFFADDVTMTFMGTDRAVSGRDAVCQTITFFHETAFSSAIEVTAMVCGEGEAMLEAEFVGTHIGEFEGLAPSLKPVRVPYAVAYTVRDGRITALRLYFPFALLMQQLTGSAEAAVA
jgi:ketosteroid isomerase-like protein